ncbi:MAG: [protein-PII] uridylyltransferase [Acidobacteriota bacterium]
MQFNLATIEQHAIEKLHRIESQHNSVERLNALKKFIKTETQRLWFRHRFGIGGREIVRARSLIVDLLIRVISRRVVDEQFRLTALPGFAVIAVGGYGRQELAPHSDIDLMFLYQDGAKAQTISQLSEEILYSLWDIGFTVGHSLRSLKESISIGKDDIVSRNSMVDARLLFGNHALFKTLTDRLEKEVFEKQKDKLLAELMSERLARYNKFGEVACVQEPNIKETAGGLRDFHYLMWACRIAYGYRTLQELVSAGIISEREARLMNSAYDFLLQVRNDLHFLTSRQSDLLSFDLQQQVARNLRYENSDKQQASEIFMRDYYLHARNLKRLTESQLNRATKKSEYQFWFRKRRTPSVNGGFVARNQALDFSESIEMPVLKIDGARMMQAFNYAQSIGMNFSSRVQESIQQSLPEINRRFIASPIASQGFLKTLRLKGRVANGLRLMHDHEFLSKFMPEFGRITCLVQHDLYHRYTVDEHTLRAIETLDLLANSQETKLERYRKIYAEITDPAILHLGLLLHDIGKGLGGGHTEKGIKIAQKICARLHLESQKTEQVLFLIREHLKMSYISQRRDLADDKVIQEFAAQMGTLDNLNMLTLLTYGDINGVGPGVWNEWKDTLLWELYAKARGCLAIEDPAKKDPEPRQQKVARLLARDIDEETIAKHFATLTGEYLNTTPITTIVEHIRLSHTLGTNPVNTSWHVNHQSRFTDLHLCSRNQPGLFAAIAGALTAKGINILSVRLNTRTDGLAVDSFKVRDMTGEPIIEPSRWEQIDKTIRQALSGELDVAAAVDKRLKAHRQSPMQKRKRESAKPTKITWDNTHSERCTILEVRTSDRWGLAYKIASTLASLDLDIVFAKVATEKNLALDIFYITNNFGEKLTNEVLPFVETTILNTLNENQQ